MEDIKLSGTQFGCLIYQQLYCFRTKHCGVRIHQSLVGQGRIDRNYQILKALRLTHHKRISCIRWCSIFALCEKGLMQPRKNCFLYCNRTKRPQNIICHCNNPSLPTAKSCFDEKWNKRSFCITYFEKAIYNLFGRCLEPLSRAPLQELAWNTIYAYREQWLQRLECRRFMPRAVCSLERLEVHQQGQDLDTS